VQKLQDEIQKLGKLALNYLSVLINSVDAERSFSAYNNIVTDKQHHLSDTSTRMLVKMYYNSAVRAASASMSTTDAVCGADQSDNE